MSEADASYESESQGLPEFLLDPIGILRRRWKWMVAAFVVGILATGVLVYKLELRYRATAQLLISSQRIPEDFVRTTVPEDILNRMDALVAQAVNRDRVVGLIEKYDLYPEQRERMTLAEIASVVRSDDLRVVLDPSVNSGRQQDSALVFSVSFAARTAATAAAVANEVVGLIQGEAIRLRTEQAGLATEFLQRELNQTETELRTQEGLITEFKSRYRGELPDEFDANLAKLERLQQQRQSLALQIAEAATRVTMLSSTPIAGDSRGTPQQRLDALKSDLSTETSTKTDAHPDVIALRSEIAKVEAEVAASPTTPRTGPVAMIAAEQRTVAELRAQLAHTETSISDLDTRVGRTPLRREELEAIEQKATVLREKYLEFLRKVEEAELAESLERAQQGERITVLNRAEAPRRPENSRPKLLLLGLVASIGLAGAGAIGLEFIDPVLVTAKQVESEAGLPVLGSVSRIG